MGSEEAKPEQKNQELPKNINDSLKSSPKISPRNSPKKSNPKSNPNSAMDNYLNKSPLKSPLKQPSKSPSKNPSKRNSPDLRPSKNSSVKPSKSPSKQSNKRSVQPVSGQIEDDNEFMPLMNWASEGSIPLSINLVQLILQNNGKPYLQKNHSSYRATINWNKINSNIFSFKLREQPAYQLNLQIDLQGDVMTGSDKIWMALSPINIPFGRTVKLGNFKCVNVYKKLGNDQLMNDEEQLGPSLKNIEFCIPEQTFVKWRQPVPSSLSNKEEDRKKKMRRQKMQKMSKFQPYEEVSRYFDLSNMWMGSTYVEETANYYRGWFIEVDKMDAKLSAQVKKDLNNRQEFYIQAMYKRLH